MNRNSKGARFAVCVRNEGYEAALDCHKIYRVLRDVAAERHHLLRIVDESGEDYLYPQTFFMPIEVPKAVEKALALAG